MPELPARAGAAIAIVNDAELAAHAVPTPAMPTLVVTVGFGVGGAVVLP